MKKDISGKALSQVIPTIDYLSLGQSLLLNLFVNILRHADSSGKMSDQIEGVVIIDEVDVHLHTNLQKEVLPDLIKIFPKVQFIITTHSPLFRLGMQKSFGDDGFEIYELPDGNKITADRFTEFEKAYKAFNEIKNSENELRVLIKEKNKPIIFFEGPTDVDYFKKAIELSEYKNLLENVDFKIIGEETNKGTINSNNKAMKNARNFLKANSGIIFQKTILVFDPEETVYDLNKDYENKIFVRQMSKNSKSLIGGGVEHLFTKELIEKAKEANSESFKIEKIGKLPEKITVINKKEVCKVDLSKLQKGRL